MDDIYSNLNIINNYENKEIFKNKLNEISEELLEIINIINDLKNDNNSFILNYIKEDEKNKKIINSILPFLTYQWFISNSTSVVLD